MFEVPAYWRILAKRRRRDIAHAPLFGVEVLDLELAKVDESGNGAV